MEKEEWKSVVYEDGFISQKYLVSNLGNIYNKEKDCLCIGSINSSGYKMVYFNEPGLEKPVRALRHRVVALAFVPNIENKPEINHKDGIKENCSASNLEWVTRSENIQHAFDTGLKQKPTRFMGTRGSKISVITDDIKEDIRCNYDGKISKKQYLIQKAEEYNISYSAASSIFYNIIKGYHKPIKSYNNLSKEEVSKVRSEFDGTISKQQYCIRKAEELNVSPLAIRRIIDNQSYYDPDYIPVIVDSYYRKLTEGDVISIRNNVPDSGFNKYVAKITKQYGISHCTVSNIIYGKTYKNFGGKIKIPKPHTILTKEDVIDIREQYRQRVNETKKQFCKRIAKIKGVSPETINAIIYRNSRKNI